MQNLWKLFFCILFLWLWTQSYGNFQIVEVFPNTIDDKNLEYITIQNISQKSLSLSGYILSDTSKDYNIQTDLILEYWDQQVFSRPETKLILNNSNEDVFLKDTNWQLVDQISYEKTIKWEAIQFEIKDSFKILDNSLISDEVLISWEVLISDEVIITSTTREDIFTPVINTPKKKLWEEKLLAPEVLLWFQRPSYISLSWSWNTYICDNRKEECKVNFDIRDSFTDTNPEKDYSCEIDFGVDWVIFWEEEKCNPNTVIFPSWTYEVVFKIFHVDDVTVFSEKKIIIENNYPELLPKEEEGEEEKIISSSSSSLNIFSQEEVELPEIKYSLQRPSYITELNEEDMYYCDTDQEECKVNFDLRESFSDEFPERDYVCVIDFGVNWVDFWEEGKCNPSTIKFPKWSFEITFSIYHEDYPDRLTQKKIEIYNPIVPVISTYSLTNSSFLSSSDKPRISVWSSNFIVQSWLIWSNFDYYCVKDSCKINLKYSPKYNDEKCFWNFAWGTYSHPMTLHKCNPSYVQLPDWVHELSLKVYDSNYEDNFIIFPFTVHPKSENLSLEWEWESVKEFEILEETLEENTLQDISLWIELQWKISKNKTLSWSTLSCQWVDKCSINLQWIVEWNTKGLEYTWKLNGEIFSRKLNPAGIWVEWEWMHEIMFSVEDKQKIFYVLISAGSSSTENKKTQDWKAATNSNTIKFTQNFLPLKYDGLRISGSAPIGSMVEIYLKWEKLYTQKVDKKGKYRIVSKDFLAWDYIFDTKILLDTGDEIFVERSWTFTILAEKRAFWFVVKKASSRNASSSNYVRVSPKLVLKESSTSAPETEDKLTIKQKILFVSALIFLWICMLLHMLSTSYRWVSREIFSIYLQQFSVKHKITLILP